MSPNINCLIVTCKKGFRRCTARWMINSITSLNKLIILKIGRCFFLWSDECQFNFLEKFFGFLSSFSCSCWDFLACNLKNFFCFVSSFFWCLRNLLALILEEIFCWLVWCADWSSNFLRCCSHIFSCLTCNYTDFVLSCLKKSFCSISWGWRFFN